MKGQRIMRVLKWLGVLFAVYVGFVVLFETVYLRMMQPTLESTGIPMLVITSTDEDGDALSLRVARLEIASFMCPPIIGRKAGITARSSTPMCKSKSTAWCQITPRCR